jgi:hypothetical protein
VPRPVARVDGVDDDGAVFVFALECDERVHHIAEVGRERERGHIECPEPVFGANDDRASCRARERGFPYAVRPVDHETRRLPLVAGDDAVQVDGHCC